MTTEEEVRLAKRIEEGKQKVAQVVIQYPVIIQELISPSKQLRRCRVEAKEIIEDPVEERISSKCRR